MFWPLDSGRIVTSPFGPRGSGFHAGTDFGFPGGSANRPVYAAETGTVRYLGSAQGYGGPFPHGWIVTDSDNGRCWEYGHITALKHVRVGGVVQAGEQIAVINPDSETNGGTAPHLHLSLMPDGYNPARKVDPMPVLAGARNPDKDKPMVNAALKRPDYNEYPIWSPNTESRNGTKVDLFLLHTEEGGPVKGGADRLARWLGDPARQVSYHYTISEDPDDRGVTVVDVADTRRASWSCLSANRRSINLVFAGSKASWKRADWLAQASRAIDVAAWLAAQDCAEFNIPRKVIKPPYGPPGGISDHRYVTKYLRDGSHTDVGGPMEAPWTGFPWDVFEAKFLAYAGQQPAPPAVSPPKPAPQYPRDFTDRQLLEAIYGLLTKADAK